MTTQTLARTGILPFAFAILLVGLCAVATALDALPILSGLLALAGITIASYRWPATVLLFLLVVAILVPVDLALRLGDLPRLGPTRLIMASFLVGWMLQAITNPPAVSRRSLPLVFPIALYVTFTVLSALGSIDLLRSVYVIASLVIEQFIFFYIFVHEVENPRFRTRLLACLALATGVVCALAMIEAISHWNPIYLLYPEEVLDYRAGLLRVRSTFYHPIALGCYLTLVLPFVILRTFETRSWHRVLSGLVVLVGVVTLGLTFSRGPWLSFGLQLLLLGSWWASRTPIRTQRVLAWAAVGLGLLVAIVFALEPVGNFLQGTLNPNRLSGFSIPEESSEFYRVALFQAVLDRLSGIRWVIGFGPGTFFLADVASTYAGHDHILVAADSIFARILLEQGVLGVAGFLVLMGAVVASCVRSARLSPAGQAALPVTALAAVLAFLLENTTVSMFYTLPLGLLFWSAVALALAPVGRTGEQLRTSRGAHAPER